MKLIKRERLIEMPRVSLGLEGWIEVDLIDAKTQIVKRHLRFKNIITDAGLDALCGGVATIDTLTNFCAVGTGSSTPVVGNTGLDTEIPTPTSNRTNANGSIADVTRQLVTGPPDYAYARRTRLFVEAQANGNLTEVGFVSANTGGIFWNRQLFKDGGGVPTVVTKTSLDQLRITYELRWYPPDTDSSGTVDISAVTYAWNRRVVGWTTGFGWGTLAQFVGVVLSGTRNIAASALETNVQVTHTTNFPGGGTTHSTVTPASYTNGHFYRDYEARWEPAVANFTTGIGKIGMFSPVQNSATDLLFEYVFTPTKLPKDNTKRLILNFRESLTRNP